MEELNKLIDLLKDFIGDDIAQSIILTFGDDIEALKTYLLENLELMKKGKGKVLEEAKGSFRATHHGL